jgi:hypothetical protein
MKELTIIFFCTFKFAATFPVAIYMIKMTPVETLVYTNTGGILGTFTFMYLSEFLIRIWKKYRPQSLERNRKKRKVFTAKNRRIVSIKIKYGLWGIVILNPVLLSIPIGSFLMVKYFGLKMKNMLLLLAGQLAWSVIYVLFYYYVKMLIW